MGDSFFVVLIYVDDIIIIGNDPSRISMFKHYLYAKFHLKDPGRLKYFLGIEVIRTTKGLVRSQRKYDLDILGERGMLGTRPCYFAVEKQHHLSIDSGTPIANLFNILLVGWTFALPHHHYTIHLLFSSFSHSIYARSEATTL